MRLELWAIYVPFPFKLASFFIDLPIIADLHPLIVSITGWHQGQYMRTSILLGGSQLAHFETAE